MNEEQYEKLLRDAAREYRMPRDIPRERMWARIQTSRAVRRHSLNWREAALGSFRWWPVAVGVALLVGIMLGRLGREDASSPVPRSPRGGQVTHVVPSPAEDSRQAARSRAITPYLTQVEALLTQVGVATPGGELTESIADWAQRLLGQTRLLLASPVGENKELRLLLSDLELVLVQIVRAGSCPPGTSDPALPASTDRRAILRRLRNSISARNPGTAGEEA
jgi:hypothetical protein